MKIPLLGSQRDLKFSNWLTEADVLAQLEPASCPAFTVPAIGKREPHVSVNLPIISIPFPMNLERSGDLVGLEDEPSPSRHGSLKWSPPRRWTPRDLRLASKRRPRNPAWRSGDPLLAL
jgi:hypothetical protein